MITHAFLLVALTLAIASPATVQLTDEAAVPRLSVAALKRAVDAKQVLVLDVRDAGSYAEGHIPGAVLVPLDSLQAKAPGLRGSKKPIVAYCA